MITWCGLFLISSLYFPNNMNMLKDTDYHVDDTSTFACICVATLVHTYNIMNKAYTCLCPIDKLLYTTLLVLQIVLLIVGIPSVD